MDIETRIASLEKKLRLHKRLGLIAACLVAGMIILGAAGDRTIEARKFILRDAAGRPVGIWEGAEGGPVFAMTDGAQGKLGLSIGEEGPGLTMTDSWGRTRFGAGVNRKGDYPFLAFTDRSGQPQLKLATQEPSFVGLFLNDTSGTKGAAVLGLRNGKPILFMDDKKGVSRATLNVDKDGEPGLEFRDEKGRMRVSMDLLEGGTPVFTFRSATGKIRASLTLSDKGDPVLTFSDKKAKARMFIGVSNGKPMIFQKDAAGTIRSIVRLMGDGKPWVVLFDKKGEVIWKAPPDSK